jgi:DNA polymerase I
MHASPSSLDPQPRRLLIVDGHAYAYRAFHAIARLRAPDGAPTNAIFGFIKALSRLLDTLQPAYVAVAWDGGLAEERLAALPGYKSQRAPMPDDLRVQFDPINAWLDASGVSWLCQDGVEADDWIATLARLALEGGAEVVVASSDKDFMQLAGPQVGLVNPADKSQTIWHELQIREKTGVGPGQIVDYLSLVGDSVDNIPGVVGVGPKTAASLLQRFGSVDALYQGLEKIESTRLRESLKRAELDVRRNQRLIRLRDDLPLELTLEQLRPRPADPARQRELAARWGFRSLASPAGEPALRQAELL